MTTIYHVSLAQNGIEAETPQAAVAKFLEIYGITAPAFTVFDVVNDETNQDTEVYVSEDGPMPPCSECGDPIDPNDPHAGHGMCASCLHDALRSGWTPGEDE